MKTAIQTDRAPKAIGPYSQAIRTQGAELTFLSGQIPLDPATGKLVEGDIRAQTEQVLKNLTAVLEAAGLTRENVVRTTIFLSDLAHFPAVNEIYGKYFTQPAPARATVQVSRLPLDALVEIDAIAAR